MQIATKERRQTQRENLSEPVLVCPCDPEYPEEICTTLNVSRTGLYFATTTDHYFPGMNVFVTLNFRSDDPRQLTFEKLSPQRGLPGLPLRGSFRYVVIRPLSLRRLQAVFYTSRLNLQR